MLESQLDVVVDDSAAPENVDHHDRLAATPDRLN